MRVTGVIESLFSDTGSEELLFPLEEVFGWGIVVSGVA